MQQQWEFRDYRDCYLGLLRAAHADRKVPNFASLEHAREALRYARKHSEEFTEEEQQLLDELYGLVAWGSLLYPLARLDPAVFAAERRARRGSDSEPPQGRAGAR